MNKFFGFLTEMMAKVSPKKTTKEEGVIDFRIGWFLFWAVAVLGLLLLTIHFKLGIIILGLDGMYLGICREIRSPNVAFLFKRGRHVGKLEAGWYLPLAPFWDIKEITLQWQETLLVIIIYTSQETAITVKAKLFWRAKDLEKVIFMPIEEMRSRIEAVGLSKLRAAIGKRDFKQINAESDLIEKEILSVICEEVTKDGYEIRDFEIFDTDEKVQSEAAKIKIIGKARGEAAGALAAHLKDNYPATAVMAITTIVEAVERIAKDWMGGARKKVGKKSDPTAAAVQKLTHAIGEFAEAEGDEQQ